MVWVLGMLAPMLLNGAAATAAPADGPSYIVVEADSGEVLAAHQEEAARYPASLTKMMTLYMTFEALRDRRITLDERVPVSLHAASMVPTKLGLLPRTRVTVRECILGMLTRSANDAAAAMGELLGGTEPGFAQMMTLRAHALGMRDTVFRNASGLPDPDQVTTARDMAVLARRLIADFPQDYGYFSTRILRVPRPDHLWPRPAARDLSGCGRHEDGIHQRGRLQSRDLGGAGRQAADRNRARGALRRAAQRHDGEPARPVLRAGWRGRRAGEQIPRR